MKASELYQAFHGANPKVRRVRYVPPKEPLVAIGYITDITYLPYGSSKRKGTAYQHLWGDTGSKVLREKPILAVSQDGRNFYILRNRSSARFSERGIIG